RGEAIAESFAQPVAAFAREIDVDAAAIVERQDAEVIDAVGMVGVFVGIENGVDAIDLGVQKLLAQVSASVDKYPCGLRNSVAPGLDQQSAAAPAIAGFVGVADAPVVADARHAAG